MAKKVLCMCLGLGLLLTAPAALADVTFECLPPDHPTCPDKCGGEVNISGATLFQNFFQAGNSTYDFIDADCDGDVGGSGIPDQLATDWPGLGSFWWLVQYRGVGSGNGLKEFVNSHVIWQPGVNPHTDWWIPDTLPDVGYINGVEFYPSGGFNCGMAPAPCCDSQTPWCPEKIHLAVMDVPTTWFTVVDGEPMWSRTPASAGYGLNPAKSWDVEYGNKLKSLCASVSDPNVCVGGDCCLNTNTADPDERTVYDNPISWVPIAIIGNSGVGRLECDGNDGQARATSLQYLFLTGRTATGENLVACTRDSGSGTRNGSMNSLGLDPSWGRGDNLGFKDASATAAEKDRLGPQYSPTNKEGSSRMEDTVQNTRLGVGYTGLLGSSRAAVDANSGKYEVFDIMMDLPSVGQSVYVRPNISSLLHTDLTQYADGYYIGGNETFASVGDPAGMGYPMDPSESAAEDYLNNILQSVAAFTDAPSDPNNARTPAEYLAAVFLLSGAVDYLPNPTDPTEWLPNPGYNPTLQAWTESFHSFSLVPYGSTIANKVPIRLANPAAWPDDPNTPDFEIQCDCPYPALGHYSDGSTNGDYHNPHEAAGTYSIVHGTNLNANNRLSGDFNRDGLRNINDIPALLQAYYDFHVSGDASYATYRAVWATDSTISNPVVPEIIGDFNGDGNFDCRDVRYFCDGLAADPTDGCQLHRWDAFELVDLTWLTLTGDDDNFFNTTIYNCDNVAQPWIPGASAADVAGKTPWPGATPHGYDCRVDCQDALYVDANFGYDWHNLDDAVVMDLSCDITNDKIIDCDDVQLLQTLMGCVCAGLEHPCDAPPICAGDMNCDGIVDYADIDPFVAALSCVGGDPSCWDPACPWLNADCNGDGNVTYGDIDPFVGRIGATCP